MQNIFKLSTSCRLRQTYIYIHTHTYVYIYIHTYIYIYIHTHTYTYINIYIYREREGERGFYLLIFRLNTLHFFSCFSTNVVSRTITGLKSFCQCYFQNKVSKFNMVRHTSTMLLLMQTGINPIFVSIIILLSEAKQTFRITLFLFHTHIYICISDQFQ